MTELPYQEDEYLTGFHFGKGKREYNNEYDYLLSSLDYEYEFIPKNISTFHKIGNLLHENNLEVNVENYGKLILQIVLYVYQKSSNER